MVGGRRAAGSCVLSPALGRGGGEKGRFGPYRKGQRQTTALFRIDWTAHKLHWILNFPHGDGRDNGYCGIAPMGTNRFLVAYYSTDGKPYGHQTSIWTAELVYHPAKAATRPAEKAPKDMAK